MRNAGLDEAKAEIKIAGRNTNNLRYTDDTTLMAESKEELKSLLMKVKSESEVAQSLVQLLATPWTSAYQAPLSMGFSRQEYWIGVPLPSPNLLLKPLKLIQRLAITGTVFRIKPTFKTEE